MAETTVPVRLTPPVGANFHAPCPKCGADVTLEVGLSVAVHVKPDEPRVTVPRIAVVPS